MKKIVGYLWALIGISAVTVISAIAVVAGPIGREVRELNLGNKYLENVDYENAVIAYSKAVEINPNSREALEGLMQAAFLSKDYETLSKTLVAYGNVMKMAGFDSESEAIICQMTRNAYGSFESNEGYIEFVNTLCEGTESDELKKLKKEADYAVIAQLMEEGKFDEANALMKELVDSSGDETLTRAKANILEMCAESAWRNREFEKALDYLKQALELAQYEADIKNDLVRLIEDYATECKNNQEYDKANELIAWLQDIRKDQSLQDIVLGINDMKLADEQLQGMIETLNEYFESDSINDIKKMMGSDEFKNNAKKISRVLFSSNLLAGNSISGKGTALYIINNTCYVYYGDYVNGKREGKGLWYYYDSRGTLAKYDLEWKNNLPQGAGSGDFYSSVDIVGPGGVVYYTVSSHEKDTFNCVDGVLHGEYVARNTMDDGTSYTMKATMVNGYAPRIEPGNFPKEIEYYQPYPRALAMYAEDNYGSHYWRTWTPKIYMVDGISTLSKNNYSIGQEEIAFN